MTERIDHFTAWPGAGCCLGKNSYYPSKRRPFLLRSGLLPAENVSVELPKDRYRTRGPLQDACNCAGLSYRLSDLDDLLSIGRFKIGDVDRKARQVPFVKQLGRLAYAVPFIVKN